ncbi:1-deoxy-D-xylulose 5-phosphate reductoisomerase [Rosistilla carotiformis]|uniref:1-deoxy-D-xylulose 5-phosphate reductoisomerase n=1 Tax=Rosistilla carotiformis TaxID=2528017 RepID=A0A518JX80_9BACT|nr:1-deoxy-D-xylulose-5-phosphate reductoisomerase [Rosistilla carotiformis]QDV70150.1 1-deoxy-D-xylulose 5-phosphate reductoisomerase [Rosistilla carotiformis]
MAVSTRNVAILGATGSIGRATLDVVASLGAPWAVWGVSGHSRVEELSQIARQTIPEIVALTGDANPQSIDLPGKSRLLTGPDALIELATAPEVDVVMAAIVGRAGLESTLAALQAGKRVALANKEALVVGGPLVHAMRHNGSELLPVDSEHSAIFQCLTSGGGSLAEGKKSVRKLILTSSGGPFRTWTTAQMRDASVEDALKHPTWNMGRKISIDSATMLNKGLEVIEARWLFDIPAEKIEVVVHPQSIIHSMVEFEDGSILAQLSPPDMRLPIQYALTYPERLPCIAPPLDRSCPWDLSLEPVDHDRFPALNLAFEVARVGGTAGAVVNAANEQAVALFLDRQIRFTDIVPACRMALENHQHESDPSLQRLLQLDRWARAEVQRWSCGMQA